MVSRRKLLGGVLGGVAVVGAWIGRGYVGSPSADAPEPELRPGERTTFTVTAQNVGLLTYSPVIGDSLPMGEPPTERAVVLERRAVDPSPATALDSSPRVLYWWIPQQTVELTLEARVAEHADPGEYRYGVSVYNRRDREDAEEFQSEFSITVVDD